MPPTTPLRVRRRAINLHRVIQDSLLICHVEWCVDPVAGERGVFFGDTPVSVYLSLFHLFYVSIRVADG